MTSLVGHNSREPAWAPISPRREMGAYEALWLQKGATFKTIAEKFEQSEGALPSDLIPPSECESAYVEATRVLARRNVRRFGIRIHGTGDYPEKLRDAKEPVELLYFQGSWEYTDTKTIAVVGTRKPSREGILRTRKLAKLLVKSDFTLVSGLAAGIDTEGPFVDHQGRGPYDRGHRDAYRNCVSTGEFHPPVVLGCATSGYFAGSDCSIRTTSAAPKQTVLSGKEQDHECCDHGHCHRRSGKDFRDAYSSSCRPTPAEETFHSGQPVPKTRSFMGQRGLKKPGQFESVSSKRSSRMSTRFQKVEEDVLGDHAHLTPEDSCFFWLEYTSGRDYTFGKANSFINNLKKPLRFRDRPEVWQYKLLAISNCARALDEGINHDWLQSATLVPVPPSKARNDPCYDDRMLGVLENLNRRHPVDFRELVVQTKSLRSSHEAGEDRVTIPELLGSV